MDGLQLLLQQPLRGDSLLFTIQSPGVPVTDLTLIIKPPSRFESGTLEWESSALTTRIIGKTYLKH